MAGVKGKSGSHKKPITDNMKYAARMVAEGVTQAEISRQLKVSQSAVSQWLDRQEVIELRDAHLKKMVKAMVGKAYAVLSAQLEDENQWIRQGAAREIIRIGERQQEIDDRTIEVEFVNMLSPGTPPSADDDQEASAVEVLEPDRIDE